MFEGFADERVDVGGLSLRVRHAGRGPVVLLVHGHPRTGSTWREWAVDLRGRAIDSGHHVAEDNPDALVAALTAFLGEVSL